MIIQRVRGGGEQSRNGRDGGNRTCTRENNRKIRQQPAPVTRGKKS